jgi:hypothetical protein
MLQLSAIAPVRLTRPKLGRRPVTPQRADGEMIDPQVSVPIVKPARPDITPGQLAHSQLGHQHRAGILQAPHHRRVRVDHLILERRGAPGGANSTRCQQIFRAPWDTVQRPTVAPGRQLLIGAACLQQRQLFG